MSPQPRAPKAPEAEQVATPVEQKAGEHNPFVHGLLTQAQSLSDELRGEGGLHERIGANRDILRQIKTTGLLSKEQADAIEEFYPVRKARTADAAAETTG